MNRDQTQTAAALVGRRFRFLFFISSAISDKLPKRRGDGGGRGSSSWLVVEALRRVARDAGRVHKSFLGAKYLGFVHHVLYFPYFTRVACQTLQTKR